MQVLQASAGPAPHGLHHLGADPVRHVVALGLPQRGAHLILDVDQRLDGLLGALQRRHHDILGDFIRAALDHQQGVARPGHPQIEVGVLQILEGGVDDELALDAGDANRSDRSAKGHVRDGQRRRGADDPERIDRGFAVGREGVQHDLDIVAHVLGEERPQRPVRQPGGQDGRLRRAAFATEERARDAPAGVQPFLVVDGEWEEVDALARLLAHGGGGKEHRIRPAHRDGTARQRGELAGLDREGLAFDDRAELSGLQHGIPFRAGAGSGQGLETVRQTPGGRAPIPNPV